MNEARKRNWNRLRRKARERLTPRYLLPIVCVVMVGIAAYFVNGAVQLRQAEDWLEQQTAELSARASELFSSGDDYRKSEVTRLLKALEARTGLTAVLLPQDGIEYRLVMDEGGKQSVSTAQLSAGESPLVYGTALYEEALYRTEPAGVIRGELGQAEVLACYQKTREGLTLLVLPLRTVYQSQKAVVLLSLLLLLIAARAFGALKYLTLLLGAFLALLPVVACVLTAFKTEEEYGATSVVTPPKNWLNFDNFVEAWSRANMGRAFLNSFIVLVCVLFASVLLGTMLAYVLNRFRFIGNGLIRNLFLFAVLIPGIAMQVTVYSIMTSLNLVDTLYGYIILLMGTDVISIYIFIQFYENIPVSLDESAIVDGASYYRVFFQILFPLLRPAIVTCMILKGVSTYNEYYMANLYLQTTERLSVVSTSLYTFTGPLGSKYTLICAGVLITLLPALLIFLLCQKQIYSGLTQGAVKG